MLAGCAAAIRGLSLVANGISTSKLAQGNCDHTAIGEVEKYKGTPPEVGVFKAPTAGA